MSDIPIIMTESGAQPTPPKTLLSNLIASVSTKVPGYTANLPAGLITDLASTATGALAIIDQMRVDLINSVSPYGANIPMLQQLGNIYGISRRDESNTSVYVTFIGPPGFYIASGFTVSDGNNQYSVVHDTIIPSSGQTAPVYCLAKNTGSWAVPAGTVTQIITSVPIGQTITCTNVAAGLPGAAAQTYSSYRAQVIRAGMSAVQGTPDMLRSELEKVNGVQGNLISLRQPAIGQWAVTVGGGDPFEVAKAIYKSMPDISSLTNNVTGSSGAAVQKKTVTISVYPDTYQVPFIIPTSQNVSASITWNTAATTFIDPVGVVDAVQRPVADYINGIAIGQPINIFEIQRIFMDSAADLIPPTLISMIEVNIVMNGVTVAPDSDSTLVFGDSYSFFSTSASAITVKKFGS